MNDKQSNHIFWEFRVENEECRVENGANRGLWVKIENGELRMKNFTTGRVPGNR